MRVAVTLTGPTAPANRRNTKALHHSAQIPAQPLFCHKSSVNPLQSTRRAGLSWAAEPSDMGTGKSCGRKMANIRKDAVGIINVNGALTQQGLPRCDVEVAKMLRSHQSPVLSARARKCVPIVALAAVTLFGGCSANIASLEGPSSSRMASAGPVPPAPIGRANAGAPPAYENKGWGNSGPRVYDSPAPQAAPYNDRVASLPDATAPVNPSRPFDAPRKTAAATQAAPQTAAARSGGTVPVVAGQTIEVQQGDSLYGISKRYRVSIAALMDLNGLKTPNLKPGQKIALPSNAKKPLEKPAPHQAAAAPLAAPTPSTIPAPTAAASSNWNGSYVVKNGDSLYGIARAHKTTVAELQRTNGITDALKMKPGMTLKVPAGAATADATPATSPATSSAATPAPGGVRLLNPPAGAVAPVADAPPPPPAKVAGLGPVAVPAAPVSGKFLMPAHGPILAGFGKRPDGAHNDGINIAVPAGADIAAAEAGTVAYAGSEIKAYGNLILLRHEGGWVTAYAHADQLLVKRGDTIKRGQIIAKAGATGSVDQPQVHFELRQGSKPVDPAPHMDK